MDVLEIVASPFGAFVVLVGVVIISLWVRGPSHFFEWPPAMPTWYWIIYWTMPMIGIIILLYQDHRPLSGLYIGAQNIVLIPLMWRKAPPGARPWVVLFLVILSIVVFWTTLKGI